MYNQSFTKSNISSMLKRSDYYRQKNLATEDVLHIDRAHKAAAEHYAAGLAIIETPVKKKKKVKVIFSVKNFWDRLVLRKVTKNIEVMTHLRHSSRDDVIKNLIKILEENVKYRVYRRDIKDFYGSLKPMEIVAELEGKWRISRPTIKIAHNILSFFSTKAKGLPRGLQISASLGELAMCQFDKIIKEHKDVFFYARFVDDIIIVTSCDEDKHQFSTFLASSLPTGLIFSAAPAKNKTLNIQVSKNNGSGASITQSQFDFLGYVFVINTPLLASKKKPHEVKVSLSNSKIKKIKTRVIKSFLAYFKDRNFALLRDRVKLLTANYYMYDRDYNSKRMAGIYFSHQHATDMASALQDLDKFLINTLLSGNGRISSKLNILLSKGQRRELLALTFKRGYNKKIIHHFSSKYIPVITGCWKHG